MHSQIGIFIASLKRIFREKNPKNIDIIFRDIVVKSFLDRPKTLVKDADD